MTANIIISEELRNVLNEWHKGETLESMSSKIGCSPQRLGQIMHGVVRSVRPEIIEKFRNCETLQRKIVLYRKRMASAEINIDEFNRRLYRLDIHEECRSTVAALVFDMKREKEEKARESRNGGSGNEG